MKLQTSVKRLLRCVPDKLYLRLYYFGKFRRPLHLRAPKTFNEKLQWLKLYDRKPEYTKMVDKYEAKTYVAEQIGEKYIIPTLGVWDRFEDIDFEALPEKFVLKCTHDSGGLVICPDKSKLNREAAREKIEQSLKYEYFYEAREWPYKNVRPRIIAEQYVEDMDELVEYKMFCFDGKVKMILVCKGQAHGAGRTNDFCDLELKRLPFTSVNPNSNGELKVPKELPEMIDIAEKLAAGIPHLRVDTYLAEGKIYFGELTFFHNGGLSRITPFEWDKILGDWITLPEQTEE